MLCTVHTIESLDLAFREAAALAAYQPDALTRVRVVELLRFAWENAEACELARNMDLAIERMEQEFTWKI